MIRSLLSATLLALAPPAAALAAQAAAAPPVALAQLTIHERIVIRLPRIMPDRPPPRPLPPIEWHESGGPKCIASTMLVGAQVLQPNAVDLLTNDGGRLRARLDRACTALDYYSGFYIRPGTDGQVCARRDSIRARTGESCRIDAFRRLKPRRGHGLP